MVNIRTYKVHIISKRGDHVVDIRAFNKPQARRKLMSQYSAKRDSPTVKSIKLVAQ